MGLTYLKVLQLVGPLLQWLTYRMTPLATLSILSFGALAVIASFIARAFVPKSSLTPLRLLDALLLWLLACASTILWLAGVLILRSQGLA